MKTIRSNIIFTIILLFATNLVAQTLKPYILGATSDAPLAEVSKLVTYKLEASGFQIIGEYSPAKDENRKVTIITSDELLNAVKSIGGLTGFASALRVAITVEDGITNISYTNPAYLGNAYYRKDFSKVASNYEAIAANLKAAIAECGTPKDTQFGVEDGLSVKKVQKYHYMMGMEYFDDVAKLNEFDSFTDAVKTIDANLAKSGAEVYSVELADQKLRLYGIALSGDKGEEHFLPIIDITTPKHTAFLPYELLVIDKEAVILHGRYRIALSFPDLTMMTFGKIMSTPGDIKNALKKLTE